MAAATTIKFSKFRVLLGDGASPETFSNPCGFNSRSLNRIKNLNDIVEPDCDDDDEPAWIGREVASLSWSVSGEGILADESIATWEDFFDSTVSRNVQIEIELPSGTRTMNGAAHLSSFTIGANRGEKVTTTVELQGDGALVTAP